MVSNPDMSQIFEQSSFANEIGAAIHLCPNASRVVLDWGFDPIQARLNLAKTVSCNILVHKRASKNALYGEVVLQSLSDHCKIDTSLL